MKFSTFTAEKNLCILHGQVFVTFATDIVCRKQPSRKVVCTYCSRHYFIISLHSDTRKRLYFFRLTMGKWFINAVHQKNMSGKCIPLEPLFYIAKLGYGGVYLFFLFLLQNIDCGYSLEPPRQGGSDMYPKSMF